MEDQDESAAMAILALFTMREHVDSRRVFETRAFGHSSKHIFQSQ